MSDQIDTRTAANHRRLRFESIDEVLAEIDRIVQADEDGHLQTAGNWTAGQIMAHIAAWIEYGYEGFPLEPPPWFIRWILRWQLKKYLRDGFPTGVRIPRIENGTVGMDEMPTREAADRLKSAFQRLDNGDPANFHSPAFGEMKQEDRIRLNLRHAELHLGFVNY